MEPTYQIGDLSITKIPELTLTDFAPTKLLPNLDPKLLSSHPSWMDEKWFDPASGNVLLSVHSWLVKTPHHVILIDTGAGNNKPRPSMPMLDQLHEPFLERLRTAGVEADQVDYVLLTHLHADHVGWNTRLAAERWVPTFPNATYIFSKLEQEYGAGLAKDDEGVQIAQAKADLGTPVRMPVAGVYADSIQPVLEAGLAKLISVDEGEVLDGISFHPTPGHSIDHAVISLRSDGEEALFGGDVLHSEIEIYQPDLISMFCEFPNSVQKSREWLLSHAAETNATYFSSHFSGSSVGRISKTGNQFAWHSA